MALVLEDHLDRSATWRRAGSDPRPWSTVWLTKHTGATYRQLDYWIRLGILGSGLRGGSGSQRRFTAADYESVIALAQLAALGAQHDILKIAVVAVRSRRVSAMGERLVVQLDGTWQRHPVAGEIRVTGSTAWVVTLLRCPFSPAGVPSDSTAGASAGDDPKGSA